MNHRRAWAQNKLDRCVRNARNASADYRATRDRRYLELKREAMQDARYWRRELDA